MLIYYVCYFLPIFFLLECKLHERRDFCLFLSINVSLVSAIVPGTYVRFKYLLNDSIDNWKWAFLAGKSRIFHQIFKSVCGTKEVKNHWYSKASKNWLEICCLPGGLSNGAEGHKRVFSFSSLCFPGELLLTATRISFPKTGGEALWTQPWSGWGSEPVGHCWRVGQEIRQWASSREAVIFFTPVSGGRGQMWPQPPELPWRS